MSGPSWAYDSTKLPLPQDGERVLKSDEVTFLMRGYIDRAISELPERITVEDRGRVLRATFEEALGELVYEHVITLRKGPKGGFVLVVAPPAPRGD
ncbi:MAG TPA: hypothetical protein VGN08_13575 [Solirubrobacteraceae bacterium]|jgi:hypothetical protein